MTTFSGRANANNRLIGTEETDVFLFKAARSGEFRAMLRKGLLAVAVLAIAIWPGHVRAESTPVPLVNSGFEGVYGTLPGDGSVVGGTAKGWVHNSGYGDTTTVYARETGNPHGGASCQSIAVSAVRGGNLQLLQGVPLHGDSIYTLGAWLRGTSGSVVDITVQGSGPEYQQIANASLRVTGAWQFVSAQGFVQKDDSDAAIVIGMNAPGKVCIDDVTLSYRFGKVTPTRKMGPVPASFFGVHDSNFQYSRLRNGRFQSPAMTVGTSPDPIRGTIAHGWEDNSAWADVDIDYHPDSTRVPTGGAAQAVEIKAVRSGRQQLMQRIAVLPGQDYVLTASLRGTPGLPVEMFIQNSEAPYNTIAARRIADLGPGWRTYSLRGGAGEKGLINLTFAADTPGTYAVADVHLTTVDGKPAPAGVKFPPARFGTLRLWDSGTSWALIEPQPGKWVFDQLDRWVNAAAPGQDVILTLGQSPTWASSDPQRITFYGAGASAPPRDLADWIDYITVVAQRYKGRIKYYEVWNEPNDPTFYSGSVAELAKLTRTASETIRAIDPAARLILAPPYSPGYLDQYLATGAAKYADIIGYHAYATPPEEAARQLANVRLVISRWKLTAMPLWDTEGGSGNADTPPDVAATYMARKYLVDLAFGAGNFGWYGWGPGTPYAVGTVEAGDARTLTPAAKAFGVVRGWLAGASMTSAKVDVHGNWRIGLDLAGGAQGLILWNPSHPQQFAVPANLRGGVVKDLNGKVAGLQGASILLDYAPVLVATR